MVKNINMACDWLGMFTKANERLYLAFFVTMGKTREELQQKLKKTIRAKQWRETEKSRRRHEKFVTDYIRVKYFTLYGEACSFYNALNTIHPTKKDLCRTNEYKNWKKETNKVKRHENRIEQIEELIESSENNTEQPEMPIESPDSDVQQPEMSIESPESNVQQPEMSIESPESNVQQPEMSIESPGSNVQQPEMSIESPESNVQQSEMPTKSPKTPDSGISPKKYNDRMRLEIPLRKYVPHKTATVLSPKPALLTQTIETVMEETLEQSTIENDILNELTTERIDQIISELRQDPELQDVFAQIELDVREEEGAGISYDLEVDIGSPDYRLEAELLNW